MAAKRASASNTVDEAPPLPSEDNTSEALAALQRANKFYRSSIWPSPFDTTRHQLRLGDARDLSWVNDSSVQLVVTSPPYWTLKKYEDRAGQLGDVADYESFLNELDQVWAHCFRVLVEGGRVCCVVGDVCVPRRRGRHQVFPLHADIMVRARRLGFDCVTGILWHKIANGVTEAAGNGAGFYGKPYQPNAVIKNDIEYILFLRKPTAYRSVPPIQKALSMLTKEEMQGWFRSIWSDVRGASTRDGHPAPYPIEIPDRLIRMFSFAGDTVLDPFSGTGSTSMAAALSGRNSLGTEIEPKYLNIAVRRLEELNEAPRLFGATNLIVEAGGDGKKEITGRRSGAGKGARREKVVRLSFGGRPPGQ
ncbi:MAG TPA: site-specific DNA-methyltransferase [Xanthobacteraceae bacterium]|nr:site-specific DNA-methyltransferase [Xanthobacteraceae bacterium]